MGNDYELDIPRWSLRDIRDSIEAREISCVDVCRAYLSRIVEYEPKIGAFTTVLERAALDRAKHLDKTMNGSHLPLAGIPLAIKDNICTNGTPTTCASRILEGFTPPYNATVIERLLADGAIVLAKTNMDEFAMGSSTEHSARQQTRNPWDLTRVPGGSSGGSAAAVAARFVPGALGSDTGGSIRQPAAFCGVVGMKPTYGLVSRYGLIAFASSLDQIGPIAKTVYDCALLAECIAGNDQRDSTSLEKECVCYTATIDAGVRGKRVGYPKEYFASGLDPEVKNAVFASLKIVEDLGGSVEEISLSTLQYAVPTYYILSTAEASSNLARYDGVRYGYRDAGEGRLEDMYKKTRRHGFGDEVKRRIMLGTYALSAGYYEAYYGRAQRVREQILNDFRTAFNGVDLICAPTTPTPAFPLGEKIDDPLQMYLADVYTVSASLAGFPALSLPCGLSPEGLPIGLQIVADYTQEELLLQAAYALEAELDLTLEPPQPPNA